MFVFQGCFPSDVSSFVCHLMVVEVFIVDRLLKCSLLSFVEVLWFVECFVEFLLIGC